MNPPNFQPSPELLAQVTEWRRHLHQWPVLSFEEQETAVYIHEQLEQMQGLEVSQLTPTSVLDVLRGTGSGVGEGHTVLLRADIDALPITEQTGLEYTSEREGVMHACGHDGQHHSDMARLTAAVRVFDPETRAEAPKLLERVMACECVAFITPRTRYTLTCKRRPLFTSSQGK